MIPQEPGQPQSPRLRRTLTVLVVLLTLVLVATFAATLLRAPTCPERADGTTPRATWSWRTTDGWQCPAEPSPGVRA